MLCLCKLRVYLYHLMRFNGLQVYGDGVMDEAPLLILTNYHVTFFLRRSATVVDKRLWASPAVWWNQTEPPPRVCWLYALQQAEQLRQLKASLLRVAVPYTLMGHPLPQRGHPPPLRADSDEETQSTSPSRASKRRRTAAQQAAQQVIVLNAHSTSGKGYEKHSLAAELHAPATGGVHPLNEPALPDSLAMEPVLGLDTLALSDTLLGAGRYGQVLQVSILTAVMAKPQACMQPCCSLCSCMTMWSCHGLAAFCGLAVPLLQAGLDCSA